MAVWEVDFYRRPLRDGAGNPLWELVITEAAGTWQHCAVCSQAEASSDWLRAAFKQLAETGKALPDCIRVFRPQSLSLLTVVGEQMGFPVEPTRDTPALKRLLEERSRLYPTLPNYQPQPYDPLAVDKPPPMPLPEKLWGDRWRFATLAAADMVDAFTGRMIPVLSMPDAWLPLNLGLASTTLVPGVVIDGGRQSMRLASWLQQAKPSYLSYMAGAPDGLILEAGLADRWIVATFEDTEVAAAAQNYEQLKRASQGLHFFLVQPDDSGMTYSGFWLLRA